MKNRKLFAPDLLRVLSMLFVVFYHVNMELRGLGRDPALAPIDAGVNIEFGQLGTVLFLILAGFTSVLSYERTEGLRMQIRVRIIRSPPSDVLLHIALM